VSTELFVEFMYALLLFLWVAFIVYVITKKLYEYMIRHGVPHNRAVYYNRKVIHVLTGGLIALLVPYLFRTPITMMPFIALLAILTYLPHRSGKLLYWFQTADNKYEVHFIISWGLIMTLSWLLFDGNWWYGVIPVTYMAFGDSVTGVVRNIIYGRRTKAWVGNIAMALVTIPIGYMIFGLVGAIAGLVASIVEHFEVNPIIDDNLLVPFTSFIIIAIGSKIV